MTRMITLDNITKSFRTKTGRFTALDQVSLSINDGEIFGIIGESGAGKSTLVRCINLLEQPDSGRILINGNDITQRKGRELRELRNSIGMIFQNFSLFQQRTVFKNILFASELSVAERLAKTSLNTSLKTTRKKRAHELISLVGLSGKEDAYPSQLSGGQQQRVAIARALMTNPSVLLCDEATSALDTLTTASVLELLGRINRELGVTIVLITHSLTVARQICGRIAVMEQGHIVEEGSTQDIFDHPQSDIARRLIGLAMGISPTTDNTPSLGASVGTSFGGAHAATAGAGDYRPNILSVATPEWRAS